ncbi:hypothetical protein KIH74_29845 [Kineosporia sp. J2-2]|uniref:Holin n=1 Tax=Kineosporia corallincola TaxID=2835133 RepID=A0ABS5TRA9_9ACTN|nr:hypothetical protein [Kineosporia corallincola]MBT0773184.1 hypothetical protein [Kineosporia corallincola]
MTDYSSTSATSTGDDYRTPRRLSTETKASTKTTELIVYVAAVLAVAITALVVGSTDTVNGGQTPDPFSANDALRYITYLTIGYMVARGLAKSGSRDNYDA